MTSNTISGTFAATGTLSISGGTLAIGTGNSFILSPGSFSVNGSIVIPPPPPPVDPPPPVIPVTVKPVMPPQVVLGANAITGIVIGTNNLQAVIRFAWNSQNIPPAHAGDWGPVAIVNADGSFAGQLVGVDTLAGYIWMVVNGGVSQNIWHGKVTNPPPSGRAGLRLPERGRAAVVRVLRGRDLAQVPVLLGPAPAGLARAPRIRQLVLGKCIVDVASPSLRNLPWSELRIGQLAQLLRLRRQRLSASRCRTGERRVSLVALHGGREDARARPHRKRFL